MSGTGAPGAPPTNRLAIAALISGVAAWFICPLLGGVLAIQLARGARREMSFTGEAGIELTKIATVLGWINVVAAAIPLLFIAAVGVLALLHR